MSEFEVKTRGNSSPDDKQRVYFSCYEDDFERCFEQICEDIFKTHDCAIYYTKDMNAEHDALNMETDLGRMNLFVIPVTYKLLKKRPKRTMEDLAFAQKHHIAVLPIMMEETDNYTNKLYEENFGEMQYLNRCSNDPTEISYEEKLKKRLDEILISPELVERIRAAFYAYIFLSYRKIDRIYVNELLKIIHNIPGCYDIAVWYDEYLTPGENFREIIYKMLKKSKLFTLLVTPNLLEEGNFVMKDEYPAAKGKMNILPTEMVSTDRQQLEEKYSNIPNCVDPYSEEFKHAVSNVVSDILNRDKNDSPEHNYLIGLAYLNGIDAEYNAERAVSLISAAADADLPEAIKKLVSIYHNGDGVKRDYEISLDWQKKLADYYERLFKKDPTEENYYELFKATLDLGDACYDMRRLNDAKVSYHHIEELAKEYGKKNAPLAVSYERLGDIATEERKLDEAKQYYIQSLEIRKALAEETEAVESRRDLFVIYGKLAKCEAHQYYLQSLELSEALAEKPGTEQSRHDFYVSYKTAQAKEKKYYMQCLEIIKALAEETGTVEARRDLATIYFNLGNIADVEGKLLGEAKQYYIQSLEIRKALAEETGTVESRRNLSLSYDKMGFIFAMEKKLDEANQYRMQSFEINKALAEETGTVEARCDLASSYTRFGIDAKTKGKLGEAKHYFLQSIEIDKTLAEETGTVEARRALAENYGILGDIAEKEKKLDEAKKYYMQELEIRKAYAADNGTVDDYNRLATSYINVGSIAHDYSMLMEAYSIYSKLIEHHGSAGHYAESQKTIKSLMEKIKTEKSRYSLAISYYNRGFNARFMKGKLGEGKQYFLQCLEIIKTLPKEIETAGPDSLLSKSYLGLSDIAQWEGKLDEAKQYYIQYFEIIKAWAEETGTVEARRKLAFGYGQLGDFAQKEGKLYEAKQCYMQSLEIIKAVFVSNKDFSKETSTVFAGSYGSLRNIAASYNNLGNIAKTKRKLDVAKQYYMQSLEIRKALTEGVGAAEEIRRELAASYFNLGSIAEVKKKFDEAKQYYMQASEIGKALAEETGTVQAHHSLAVNYERLGSIAEAEGKSGEAKQYYMQASEIRKNLAKEPETV